MEKEKSVTERSRNCMWKTGAARRAVCGSSDALGTLGIQNA